MGPGWRKGHSPRIQKLSVIQHIEGIQCLGHQERIKKHKLTPTLRKCDGEHFKNALTLTEKYTKSHWWRANGVRVLRKCRAKQWSGSVLLTRKNSQARIYWKSKESHSRGEERLVQGENWEKLNFLGCALNSWCDQDTVHQSFTGSSKLTFSSTNTVIIPWVPAHLASNPYPSPLTSPLTLAYRPYRPPSQSLSRSSAITLAFVGSLTPNSFLSWGLCSASSPTSNALPSELHRPASSCSSDHSLHPRPWHRHLTWPPGSSTTLEPPEGFTLILCTAPPGISIFYYWNEFSPSPLVTAFPLTNLLKFICNPQINTPDAFVFTRGQEQRKLLTCPTHAFPAEVPQGDALLPCVSSSHQQCLSVVLLVPISHIFVLFVCDFTV